MTTRVAINGFGRIGRLIVRAAIESGRTDVEFVAVNGLDSLEVTAHLFKYDTMHGTADCEVGTDGDDLMINGKRVKYFRERDPKNIPWGSVGVDVVVECTGIFRKYDQAAMHIEAGAKKVLISAPGGANVEKTIVYGVNEDELVASDLVVSNASCTTNCLAPVVKVLNDLVGIERGYCTTVHAYTSDQRLIDNSHSDLRRARTAAMSIIPTSTGAAKAVGKVLPEMAGKLDGGAFRVPTANVSLIDLTFDAGRDTSVEEINGALKVAADCGRMSGVLDYNELPLVSIDYNHCPASSSVDALSTQVLEGRFVRVVSWYDNEWGFSNRMLDTASLMGRLG